MYIALRLGASLVNNHSHSILDNPKKAGIGAGFSMVAIVNTIKSTIINNRGEIYYDILLNGHTRRKPLFPAITKRNTVV